MPQIRTEMYGQSCEMNPSIVVAGLVQVLFGRHWQSCVEKAGAGPTCSRLRSVFLFPQANNATSPD